MNIPPSDARLLSLWEYEALLWNWNDAHSGIDVEPPDPHKAQAIIDKLNADPRLTGKGAALQSA